ncbi:MULTISPECIES: hypothetical protein [Planktothricoides]|uniref:Uncharacterized protein n=2 Tax=Planktothricoides raciborskii TaxID=132608 RepID=A0AAU8J768_9CYAN|nr:MULTISPECIES: hypothetical protein [Planktothricoides]MBD2546792.1 hypothetical protein [Planktothricoides raciborskii FACHB-1370]MBD2583091.1 hypothetical protein [Planktothricoides raciborskii FACHB-1261]
MTTSINTDIIYYSGYSEKLLGAIRFSDPLRGIAQRPGLWRNRVSAIILAS